MKSAFHTTPPQTVYVYLPSSLQRFLKYLLRAELVNDYLDKRDWKCWAAHTGACCRRETNSNGFCSWCQLVNVALTLLTLCRLEVELFLRKLKGNIIYAFISNYKDSVMACVMICLIFYRVDVASNG